MDTLPNKSILAEHLASIGERWPCFGLPAMIAVDNGLDLTSKAVRDACMQAGIEILYTPPRQPWYKGVIERFGRSINTRFIHWLPGTTLGKQIDSYDYDAKKDAAILDTDFERLLEFYVTEVHNRSPRKGKPGIPIDRWNKGIDEFPPRLPLSREDFDAAIALTKTATISKDGVVYEYLKYNNSELGKVWNRVPDKQEVILKINPLDLTKIIVINPLTDDPISVPCLTNIDYPAVLDYHKAVVAYTKQQGQSPDNAVHLTEAEAALRKGFEDAAEKGRKALRAKNVEYLKSANRDSANSVRHRASDKGRADDSALDELGSILDGL